MPRSRPEETLEQVAAAARACTACAAQLPLGPRPVLRVSTTARLLIAGQAPGTKVHLSGLSFTDASGDRLRGWMAVTEEEFYDVTRVAIMPMGFCYPGRLPNGGDAPPRPECAPLWRARLLRLMPQVQLTLLVGSYAQEATLGPGAMGERVRAWRSFLPRYLPLPHPSWRTTGWERQNPWFGEEVLPELRARVRTLLSPCLAPAARSPRH
jgi:uracil-DNA glycosylase